MRTWPIACTVPYPRSSEYQDCSYDRTSITLYAMRSPHQNRCDVCHHTISVGDLITADLYHREECTLVLCEHCSRHHGPLRRMCQPRAILDYDSTAAEIVASSDNISDPSAVLLGAHSDCGYPRARAAANDQSTAWVVIDAGRPVMIDELRVHNWFHKSYPDAVSLLGGSECMTRKWRNSIRSLLFCAQRFQPLSVWAFVGRDVVRIIMEYVCTDDWVPLLCDAGLSMSSMWGTHRVRHYEPFQLFRLVFHRPKDLAPTHSMSLGIVQLVSDDDGGVLGCNESAL